MSVPEGSGDKMSTKVLCFLGLEIGLFSKDHIALSMSGAVNEDTLKILACSFQSLGSWVVLQKLPRHPCHATLSLLCSRVKPQEQSPDRAIYVFLGVRIHVGPQHHIIGTCF